LGKYWGKEGYMELFKDMEMNKDGMCGINENTHFPEYKI